MTSLVDAGLSLKKHNPSSDTFKPHTTIPTTPLDHFVAVAKVGALLGLRAASAGNDVVQSISHEVDRITIYARLGKLPPVDGLAADAPQRYQEAWVAATRENDAAALTRIEKRAVLIEHIEQLETLAFRQDLPEPIHAEIRGLKLAIGELNVPAAKDEGLEDNLHAVQAATALLHCVAIAPDAADWVAKKMGDIWGAENSSVLAHATLYHQGLVARQIVQHDTRLDAAIQSSLLQSIQPLLTDAGRETCIQDMQRTPHGATSEGFRRALLTVTYATQVLMMRQELEERWSQLAPGSGYYAPRRLAYTHDSFGGLSADDQNANPITAAYLAMQSSADPADVHAARLAESAVARFIDTRGSVRDAPESTTNDNLAALLNTDADWANFDARVKTDVAQLNALGTIIQRAILGRDPIISPKHNVFAGLFAPFDAACACPGKSTTERLAELVREANTVLGVEGRTGAHVTDAQLHRAHFEIDEETLRYLRTSRPFGVASTDLEHQWSILRDAKQPMDVRRAAATVCAYGLRYHVQQERQRSLDALHRLPDELNLLNLRSQYADIPESAAGWKTMFNSVAQLLTADQEFQTQIAPLQFLNDLRTRREQLLAVQEAVLDYAPDGKSKTDVQKAVFVFQDLGWLSPFIAPFKLADVVSKKFGKKQDPLQIDRLIAEMDSASVEIENGRTNRYHALIPTLDRGQQARQIAYLGEESRLLVQYRDTTRSVLSMAAAMAVSAGIGAEFGAVISRVLGTATFDTAMAAGWGTRLAVGVGREVVKQAAFVNTDAAATELLGGHQHLYDLSKGWAHNLRTLSVEVLKFSAMMKAHGLYREMTPVLELTAKSGIAQTLTTKAQRTVWDAGFFHLWQPAAGTIEAVLTNDPSHIQSGLAGLYSFEGFLKTVYFTVALGAPLGGSLTQRAVESVVNRHAPEMATVRQNHERITAAEQQIHQLVPTSQKILPLRQQQRELAEANIHILGALAKQFRFSEEFGRHAMAARMGEADVVAAEQDARAQHDYAILRELTRRYETFAAPAAYSGGLPSEEVPQFEPGDGDAARPGKVAAHTDEFPLAAMAGRSTKHGGKRMSPRNTSDTPPSSVAARALPDGGTPAREAQASDGDSTPSIGRWRESLNASQAGTQLEKELLKVGLTLADLFDPGMTRSRLNRHLEPYVASQWYAMNSAVRWFNQRYFTDLPTLHSPEVRADMLAHCEHLVREGDPDQLYEVLLFRRKVIPDPPMPIGDILTATLRHMDENSWNPRRYKDMLFFYSRADGMKALHELAKGDSPHHRTLGEVTLIWILKESPCPDRRKDRREQLMDDPDFRVMADEVLQGRLPAYDYTRQELFVMRAKWYLRHAPDKLSQMMAQHLEDFDANIRGRVLGVFQKMSDNGLSMEGQEWDSIWDRLRTRTVAGLIRAQPSGAGTESLGLDVPAETDPALILEGVVTLLRFRQLNTSYSSQVMSLVRVIMEHGTPAVTKRGIATYGALLGHGVGTAREIRRGLAALKRIVAQPGGAQFALRTAMALEPLAAGPLHADVVRALNRILAYVKKAAESFGWSTPEARISRAQFESLREAINSIKRAKRQPPPADAVPTVMEHDVALGGALDFMLETASQLSVPSPKNGVMDDLPPFNVQRHRLSSGEVMARGVGGIARRFGKTPTLFAPDFVAEAQDATRYGRTAERDVQLQWRDIRGQVRDSVVKGWVAGHFGLVEEVIPETSKTTPRYILNRPLNDILSANVSEKLHPALQLSHLTDGMAVTWLLVRGLDRVGLAGKPAIPYHQDFGNILKKVLEIEQKLHADGRLTPVAKSQVAMMAGITAEAWLNSDAPKAAKDPNMVLMVHQAIRRLESVGRTTSAARLKTHLAVLGAGAALEAVMDGIYARIDAMYDAEQARIDRATMAELMDQSPDDFVTPQVIAYDDSQHPLQNRLPLMQTVPIIESLRIHGHLQEYALAVRYLVRLQEYYWDGDVSHNESVASQQLQMALGLGLMTEDYPALQLLADSRFAARYAHSLQGAAPSFNMRAHELPVAEARVDPSTPRAGDMFKGEEFPPGGVRRISSKLDVLFAPERIANAPEETRHAQTPAPEPWRVAVDQLFGDKSTVASGLHEVRVRTSLYFAVCILMKKSSTNPRFNVDELKTVADMIAAYLGRIIEYRQSKTSVKPHLQPYRDVSLLVQAAVLSEREMNHDERQAAAPYVADLMALLAEVRGNTLPGTSISNDREVGAVMQYHLAMRRLEAAGMWDKARGLQTDLNHFAARRGQTPEALTYERTLQRLYALMDGQPNIFTTAQIELYRQMGDYPTAYLISLYREFRFTTDVRDMESNVKKLNQLEAMALSLGVMTSLEMARHKAALRQRTMPQEPTQELPAILSSDLLPEARKNWGWEIYYQNIEVPEGAQYVEAIVKHCRVVPDVDGDGQAVLVFNRPLYSIIADELQLMPVRTHGQDKLKRIEALMAAYRTVLDVADRVKLPIKGPHHSAYQMEMVLQQAVVLEQKMTAKGQHDSGAAIAGMLVMTARELIRIKGESLPAAFLLHQALRRYQTYEAVGGNSGVKDVQHILHGLKKSWHSYRSCLQIILNGFSHSNEGVERNNVIAWYSLHGDYLTAYAIARVSALAASHEGQLDPLELFSGLAETARKKAVAIGEMPDEVNDLIWEINANLSLERAGNGGGGTFHTYDPAEARVDTLFERGGLRTFREDDRWPGDPEPRAGRGMPLRGARMVFGNPLTDGFAREATKASRPVGDLMEIFYSALPTEEMKEPLTLQQGLNSQAGMAWLPEASRVRKLLEYWESGEVSVRGVGVPRDAFGASVARALPGGGGDMKVDAQMSDGRRESPLLRLKRKSGHNNTRYLNEYREHRRTEEKSEEAVPGSSEKPAPIVLSVPYAAPTPETIDDVIRFLYAACPRDRKGGVDPSPLRAGMRLRVPLQFSDGTVLKVDAVLNRYQDAVMARQRADGKKLKPKGMPKDYRITGFLVWAFRRVTGDPRIVLAEENAVAHQQSLVNVPHVRLTKAGVTLNAVLKAVFQQANRKKDPISATSIGTRMVVSRDSGERKRLKHLLELYWTDLRRKWVAQGVLPVTISTDVADENVIDIIHYTLLGPGTNGLRTGLRLKADVAWVALPLGPNEPLPETSTLEGAFIMAAKMENAMGDSWKEAFGPHIKRRMTVFYHPTTGQTLAYRTFMTQLNGLIAIAKSNPDSRDARAVADIDLSPEMVGDPRYAARRFPQEKMRRTLMAHIRRHGGALPLPTVVRRRAGEKRPVF